MGKKKRRGDQNQRDQHTHREQRHAVESNNTNKTEANGDGEHQNTNSKRMRFFTEARAALLVSILAFGATAYQGYIARETMRKGMRAYVAVGSAGFDCPQCQPPLRFSGYENETFDHLMTKFANKGQTPARNISMNTSLKAVKPGEILPPDFDFKETPPSAETASLNAKGFIGAGTNFTSALDSPHADTEIFLKGQLVLYVFGHVSYDDVFNVRHTLLYCLKYRADGNTADFCPRQNDEYDGDYQPPLT